jgi:hypothetical protein
VKAFLDASYVGRVGVGIASTILLGLVVALATNPDGFNSARHPETFAWSYGALTAAAVFMGAAGVALWRNSTDSFPQLWFLDDGPRLDIELGQPPDRFNTDRWAEGLQLSVKNRPWHGRKTRTAIGATLHAIFDYGERFDPNLMFDVHGEMKRVTNIHASERMWIPIAAKAYVHPDAAEGEVWMKNDFPMFWGTMKYGSTYLMDEQFFQRKPRVLDPTQYNIAIWIEHDGGRKTARRYFSLLVDKDPERRNELTRSEW